GGAGAGGGTVTKIAQRDLGRGEDDEMVRRLRQRLEILEAGNAPDLAAVRIEREYRAGKAETAQVVPHAPRPMVGAIRRPDQDHVARVKQPLDRLGLVHRGHRTRVGSARLHLAEGAEARTIGLLVQELLHAVLLADLLVVARERILLRLEI